ncbi:MAG: hypothetical protein K2J74_01130 [Muribaculaceae bacterium]|nr:hypothetical protein [Muribaculaceae bacterium]
MLYLSLADELLLIFLIALAFADSIAHNCWRKYSGTWIVCGISAFYVIYSYFFLKYNTLPYILYDALLTLKPFLAFFVLYAIAPEFNLRQKRIISYICIFNVAVAFLCMACGYQFVKISIGHVAYGGSAIYLSALIYLYINVGNGGSVNKRIIYTVTAMLISGILCTRSKYYGELIFALFAIYFYRPGMFSVIRLKQVLAVVALLIVVITAAWSKIAYYFIGSIDITSFDPDKIASFARPVLYATGALILLDYIPFGCGYASFATYPSSVNYSGIYPEYGIDKVYGLSKNYPAFICDAYYPSLAQFGFVGVVLFIYFFRYMYVRLLSLLKSDSQKYKYPFIIGVLMILYLLIESTSGTMMTQCHGMMALMLIGIIASKSKSVIITNS